MKSYLTRVNAFDETDEYDLLIETVVYRDNWWLCPPPITKLNTEGEIIPQRMIHVDGNLLRYQEVNLPKYRLVLNTPIPKAVLDGETEEGFEVYHYPQPFDTN